MKAAWAVSVGAAVIIGLLFWLHWRRSRDRFFLFFTAAFWVYALSTLILLLSARGSENHPAAYIVRLLAFLLIIAAIVDKNRPQRDPARYSRTSNDPDQTS